MTTTIGFATRDCIVLGCDSLATSVRLMVDPYKIARNFFDDAGNLLLENGAPVLKTAAQLHAFVQRVPRDQLPNVTKLFELDGAHAGVTFSGASVVGDYSVKNLVDSFNASQFYRELIRGEYSIELIAKGFFNHVNAIYEKAYETVPADFRPFTEAVVSGYSSASLLPQIYRLNFSATPSCESALQDKPYDIVFGGQYDIIQRVVMGVDLQSYLNLRDKSERLLGRYRDKLQTFLAEQGHEVALPPPDMSDTSLQLFYGDFGGVSRLASDRESLSEQAAINFVEFLLDTMIWAQQFSGEIPTVGGEIHIAIITKSGGFRWISKEEYHFHGHSVLKHSNH